MSDSESEDSSTATMDDKLLYGPLPSALVAATWRDIKARLAKHKEVLPQLDEGRSTGMQSLIDAEQWELDMFKEDYADQLADEKLSDDESDTSSSESETSESEDMETVKAPTSGMKYSYRRR